MAYTERFVSVAGAGAHDGTSAANAWTLAEGLTNAVGGQRVNVISGSYSSGADVVDGRGTFDSLICFRGYNISIGDLENQGWNADGSLDVTNYPVITLTGILSFNASGSNFCLFQNLSFTGSLSSDLVGDLVADFVYMVECKFINTANNSAARALRLDNDCHLVNCDLECSGASHNVVVSLDNDGSFIGCRIKGATTSSQVFSQIAGRATVVGTAFIGAGGTGSSGLELETTGQAHRLIGNTFYNFGKAILMPTGTLDPPIIVNNHVTDCDKYLDNLNVATANIVVIEVNNRTRDNTTPRTGIGDGANVGEVTTDTGDKDTDYTDADNDDFTLIDGAPGVEAGMRQHADIGAYQRAGGGGGGGLLVHPGMTGGVRG